MGSTITAGAIAVAVSAWLLLKRRDAGWRAGPVGRFDILWGYVLVAIAAYWLDSDPTVTVWDWALANWWALAAMIALSVFYARHRVAEHAERAQLLETVEPAAPAIPDGADAPAETARR